MLSAGAVTSSPEADTRGLPLPLTGRTTLFAILGDPIAQVGSPALLNAAFRRRGWTAVLVPMHVTAGDLPMTLQGLRGIRNLRGLVLTTPHKSAALKFVDSIGPEARLVGSVNAVRCSKDGEWHGENFDGLGCVRGLEKAGQIISGRHVLLLGTGGAGSAVAAAVARKAPASLRVYDIDQERAVRACAMLRNAFPQIDIAEARPNRAAPSLSSIARRLAWRARPASRLIRKGSLPPWWWPISSSSRR